MKKSAIGLLVGIIAGIIDVIPMIIQKLSWDANLSAFTMWVIIGFFIANSNLKVNGFLKGLLYSFLAILPIAIIIGAKELSTLIPILIMTFILGSISGFIITKLNKE